MKLCLIHLVRLILPAAGTATRCLSSSEKQHNDAITVVILYLVTFTALVSLLLPSLSIAASQRFSIESMSQCARSRTPQTSGDECDLHAQPSAYELEPQGGLPFSSFVATSFPRIHIRAASCPWVAILSLKGSEEREKSSAAMSQSFSVQDVAKHNSEKDLYIIVDNDVYNMSDFLSSHPGGKKIVLRVAGQDASKQFWKYHNAAILKKVCLPPSSRCPQH